MYFEYNFNTVNINEIQEKIISDSVHCNQFCNNRFAYAINEQGQKDRKNSKDCDWKICVFHIGVHLSMLIFYQGDIYLQQCKTI
jgi:hypothetical protein